MHKKILPIIMCMLLLCACNKAAEPEIVETTEVVTTVDDDSKILIQPWKLADVYKSVTINGENVGFPFSLDMLNELHDGYTLETIECLTDYAKGYIVTPTSENVYFETKHIEHSDDGEMSVKTNQPFHYLCATGNSISNFEIYGIKMLSTYNEVREKFGIPDEINGNVDSGAFSYKYLRNDTKYILFMFDGFLVSAIVVKD